MQKKRMGNKKKSQIRYFLWDYDEESYPSDSYEPLEELICTKTQLDSFIKTIEGCTYRLKQ